MKIDNFPEFHLLKGGRLSLVFFVVDQDNADAPLDCTGFTLETQIMDLTTGTVLITIPSADHIHADGAGTGDKVTAIITSTQAASFVPGHQILGTLRRTDSGHEYPLWRGQGLVLRLAGDN